ncbi:MAG: hypothetical protein DMF80_11760 [Acidobacteria bacterium]|nr:MAG: hypothetical protein DMF80_11760 [Acidobacteriota bacterium]PYQ23960.1 MAG: hypothetical protein DMF81_06965 [Acidobacteriota bacterium]
MSSRPHHPSPGGTSAPPREVPSPTITGWGPLAVVLLSRATTVDCLAAEDRRFFHHPGVDPLALLRAGWHDLRAGRMIEGGSTLTQQTAKVLMDRPRSIAGKLREMVLALRLEHRLGKRQILALYLSVAPYGNQRVGAEAASRAYFGGPADSLTAAQAAFLAGLPQRPSVLDPTATSKPHGAGRGGSWPGWPRRATSRVMSWPAPGRSACGSSATPSPSPPLTSSSGSGPRCRGRCRGGSRRPSTPRCRRRCRGSSGDPREPARNEDTREGLRIVNPPAGATYLRDPTLRDAFQTLPLRAVTAARSRLEWEVDGRAVGSVPAESAVRWPLTPGRHVVSVRDGRGRRDEAEILVK